MKNSHSAFLPLLNDLIDLATRQKSIGCPIKVVFDIDSTLFDVSHRICEILRDFAKLPEVLLKYPKEAETLSKLVPDIDDFGVKRTLARHGFVWPSHDFAFQIVSFWKTHFFANTYLHHDKPYMGAKEFVCALFNAGADISYLTGRDVPRMWNGTLESLKQCGFPLDNDHANLVLKPNSDITDVEFKRNYFKQLGGASNPIWFFENEPANIHEVMEHCPHVKIIFVNTVHSESAPPPPDSIERISNYII